MGKNYITPEADVELREFLRAWESKHGIGPIVVTLSPVQPAVQVKFEGFGAPALNIDQRAIKELGLTNRATNILLKAGVSTVGDLRRIPLKEIRSVGNCWKGSLEEISDNLKERGIELGWKL